ncbi:dihydrodipicolinate synthase family protein [Draconibacterium mangrovi]|uniref:dihydrodipicolinate synthase family protein n=1 Tax=Draconibacterium mangrovi TaxID=2697469 RepID=UPI0013CF616A|nr:dihydrodipicolinate synthase family protein [Draconibacterium mangrovi]
MSISTNKFEGLVAAPFTPMDKKGEVIYERISGYAGLLEKNKVVGAFINGSTGEGVSLSQKEKMKITEAWVQATSNTKNVKTINLVGGTSYIECIENAQHSADCGIDSIALLAPYYFKPAAAGQLAEFCAKIAEAVPNTPVYFYHIPVLTGCNVSMFDFLQEADSMIPNLAGIKYTHEDFMDFQSCMSFKNGKYDMLWGRDENLVSALVLGARAGVGSTFNYAAPLYYQLIDAFNESDLEKARKLQQQSIDMIRLLGKYGGIATGKAYMRYIGFECGEFRLPIKNMSNEAYKEFEKDVQGLQMQDLFSTL